MHDDTRSGGDLSSSTANYEALSSHVTPREVLRWLDAPMPVAFISANGRVLACNSLAAWVCGAYSASDLFLQNIYSITSEFILSEQIPISCNHTFRRRKLGAMGKADPRRDWPAHRNLYEAIKLAERHYTNTTCPVDNCGMVGFGNKPWCYPICIWEPGTTPGGSVEQLLQFRVTDSLLSQGDAPKDIPNSEKRFLIVFEPVTDLTSAALSRAYSSLAANHGADSLAVAPHRGTVDMLGYIDFALRNDLKYIYHHINNEIMEIDVYSYLDEDNHLGSLIRNLRARHNMSGDELAKRLGVSRGTIGHWEQGRRTPPRTLRFARTIVSILDPTDDERERLLRHVAGTEVSLENIQFEDERSGRTHPDEEFYEDMMNRADRIQRIGAQIVKVQAALDQEVEFMRTSLKERFLNPNQIGILNPPEPLNEASSGRSSSSTSGSMG